MFAALFPGVESEDASRSHLFLVPRLTRERMKRSIAPSPTFQVAAVLCGEEDEWFAEYTRPTDSAGFSVKRAFCAGGVALGLTQDLFLSSKFGGGRTNDSGGRIHIYLRRICCCRGVGEDGGWLVDQRGG
jgi:hypothetical protein